MKRITLFIAALVLIFSFSESVYATEKTFTDVKETDWYFDSIIQVSNENPNFKELFTDNLFKPQENIKFEEFLEWMAYAFMVMQDAEGKVEIPDKFGERYMKEHNYFKGYMIDKKGWLYPENYGENNTGWRNKYTLAAASNILIKEHDYYEYRDINVKNSGNKLNPYLTRNIMAEIMYDALISDYSDINEIRSFNIEELKFICNMINDTTLADQKIFTVVSEGLMTINNNMFYRNNYVTRAEAIAILHRLIDKNARKPIDIPIIKTVFDELPPVDLSHLYDIPTISGKTVKEENAEHFDYENEKKFIFYDADEVINDFKNYVKLMHNRDFNTIKNNEVEYSRRLNYYLAGMKEYKGKEYSRLRSNSIKSSLETIDRYIKEGEDQFLINSELEFIEWVKQQDDWIENFFDLWVQDTINNQVKVNAEFYTSPNLLIYANGSPALRGTLRIKYDNHINPSDIKYELDLLITKDMEHGERILEIDKGAYNIYKNFENIPQIEVGKWYEIDVDVVLHHFGINNSLYVEDGKRSGLTYGYIYVLDIRELYQ